MVHNDNIIRTSVSEAVEKIPTYEKDYRKCSFKCFTLHSHSIQRGHQHTPNTEKVVYLLACIQCSYKNSQTTFYIKLTQKKVQ